MVYIRSTFLLSLAIGAGHASAERSDNHRGLTSCARRCDLNYPCKKGGNQFYFEHCDKGKFIQCDHWGGCDEKRCPEGTIWNQGLQTCTHKVDEERTIYETVEFTVETICGSRSSVQDRLESAFLAFFEEEFEECDSDRDVEALALVKFKEAESCSDDYSPSDRRVLAEEGRRLQNDQRSRGVFNRKSTCRRCRRRLGGEPTHGSIGSSHRVLGNKGNKGSKGNKYGSKGSKYVSKGSKYGSKGSKYSSKSSKSVSKTECSADLVQALRNEGFDDVEEAEIINIKEVDCSSDSRDCTSTRRKRGACCGVYGCACNLPSASLCEDNNFCVEVAQPFDADFCEDFGDTSECVSDKYSEGRKR